MWDLWHQPFNIVGALIVFEVIRRFASNESISVKRSVLNVIIPSVIIFVVSFLGNQLFN